MIGSMPNAFTHTEFQMPPNVDVTRLTPAQDSAYQVLRQSLKASNLLLLTSYEGRGRTTVLRHLQKEMGGGFVTSKEFLESSGARHPLSLEEALHGAVAKALAEHDIVYVDDVDLIHDATSSCHFYPRGQYVETAMLELAELATRKGKTLVVSTDSSVATAFAARSFSASIPRFSASDYACLLEAFMGDAAPAIDCDKIFRFAPKLNAHQIMAACKWLRAAEAFDTDRFIEYLRSQRLASNVDLSEVEDVGLADLQGVDDVLRSLEIHIVLPLENDTVASDLGLRPKRGVLLYGPPGTGKTTIGRALAHRLRGKFFLVDGTFIAGTDDFYQRIRRVFEAARDNSPAVIFIDDADAIFEDGEERGLYRYLLTMLDGLESEGTGRVCVMMTAMNLSHLPPALIRSGRVELWLEMRIPDAAARARIVARHTANLPTDLQSLDRLKIVEVTEMFTGADVKRLVEDAKGFYAYDQVRKISTRPATDYFIEAANGVRENKQRYRAAEDSARTRPKSHSPFAGFYPRQRIEED
jgi:transitional endoplasmic reticulum ATPase